MAKNTMKKNYEMPVAEIVEFENIFAKPNGNNPPGFPSGSVGFTGLGQDNDVMPLD